MSEKSVAEVEKFVPPFHFKSVKEIYETQEPETDYCIEGLLPNGGMSVLAGKPKAGKTTLVRQAVVAVAAGQPFLGRETQAGTVLYIAIEEKESEVKAHFRQLGLPDDAPVGIWTGAVKRNIALAQLEATLLSMDGISLVVIDPVFKFVPSVQDTSDYMQVNNALEKLLELARKYSVHILLVHHMKKRESEDLGDCVLGSQAIAGAVDTFIALKVGPKGIRTVTTLQRYGQGMPETQLDWDADNRRLSLGQAAEAAQLDAAHATSKRIEEQIIGYVATNKGCTQQSIMDGVMGKVTTKKHILRDLIDKSFLRESGAGIKGDPYTYTISETPTETVQ